MQVLPFTVGQVLPQYVVPVHVLPFTVGVLISANRTVMFLHGTSESSITIDPDTEYPVLRIVCWPLGVM